MSGISNIRKGWRGIWKQYPDEFDWVGDGFGTTFSFPANAPMTTDMDGGTLDNDGAIGVVTIAMIPAQAGRSFAVVRAEAWPIYMTPDGTDTIRSSGSTYKIISADMVVFACEHDGQWDVILGAEDGTYKPLAYGAVGDGIADDTAAFNRIIGLMNASPGSTMALSANTFRLVGSLTTITASGTTVVGQGMGSTTLLIDPIADWTGFHWSLTQDVGSCLGFSIVSSDLSYTKTGVIITDTTSFLLRDVGVTFDGGGDSVGIQFEGRENGRASSLICRAPVPIRVVPNPNYAGLTLDMMQWDSIYTIAGGVDSVTVPDTLTPANVLVESGAGVSGWVVSNMIMAGGEHGVYIDGGPVYADPNYNLPSTMMFIDVRHEQCTAGSNGWSFYFDFTGGATSEAPIRSIILDNCEAIAQNGADHARGVYLRNVDDVILRGFTYPYADTWIDVDATVRSVSYNGGYLPSSATSTGLDVVNTTGLKLMHGSGHAANVPNAADSVWIRQTMAAARDYSAFRVAPTGSGANDTTLGRPYDFDVTALLHDNEELLLPFNTNRGTTVGQVFVTAFRPGGAVEIHFGWFGIMSQINTPPIYNGVCLHTGDANMKSSLTADGGSADLCLYAISSGGPLEDVRLTNRTNQDMWVIVTARFSKTVGY